MGFFSIHFYPHSMANYKYTRSVALTPGTEAELRVKLMQPGTAAAHLIDFPGDDDVEETDQCEVFMGTIEELTGGRTFIITNAININPNAEEIGITYFINDTEIVKHSNKKKDDLAPQIIITLDFQNA
jgi:hypothetical protein